MQRTEVGKANFLFVKHKQREAVIPAGSVRCRILLGRLEAASGSSVDGKAPCCCMDSWLIKAFTNEHMAE